MTTINSFTADFAALNPGDVKRKLYISAAEAAGFVEKDTYRYLKPEFRGASRGTYNLALAVKTLDSALIEDISKSLEEIITETENEEWLSQGEEPMSAAEEREEELRQRLLDEEAERAYDDDEVAIPELELEDEFIEEFDAMKLIGDAYAEAMDADLTDY